MTSFRIKEKIIDGILNVFVQGREWFGWITIKTFRAVESTTMKRGGRVLALKTS